MALLQVKLSAFFLLLLHQSNCQEERKISNETCDCKSVFDCKPYKKLVDERKFPELRELTDCGFIKGKIPVPKYCCPPTDSKIPSNQTTSTKYEFEEILKSNSIRNVHDSQDAFLSHLDHQCGKQYGLRIVGGFRVIDPHKYPWMAALVYESQESENKILCGGVIISSNIVMTAAHCISESKGTSGEKYALKKVRLGHTNVTSKETIDVVIDSILIHPNFTRTRFGDVNDIALLKLSKHLSFLGDIQPICLPKPDLQESTLLNPKSSTLKVAGWGTTRTNTNSDVLLELSLKYTKTSDCEQEFQGLLKDSRVTFELKDTRMCAHGEEGTDSCRGDSGGPLMRLNHDDQDKYEAVGIVSFGSVRCDSKTPGVYTRVSEFLPWIQDIMYREAS